MNADIFSMNTSKKSEKRPKRNNSGDLQVVHDNQVLDNINQSNVHKQESKFNPTQSPTTASTTKNIYSTTGKRPMHKLVDKQVSKPPTIYQSDKRTFLLDTYARIAATNNKRCPKRLRELAKPKRSARSDQDDYPASFDLDHRNTIKTYTDKTRHSFMENSKKK